MTTKARRCRLAQTGDWHIGVGRTSWGEERALTRSAAIIDAVYDRARTAKADALLVTGDLFEYKLVSEAERSLLARKLRQHTSGEDGLLTLMIPGNHDMRDGQRSNLDWLAEITRDGHPNLIVANGAEPRVIKLPCGPRVVLAPAFLSERTEWIENYVTTKLDASRQYVFVGHGLIGGSKTPKGRPLESGLTLAKASRAAPHVVYWAYGDIHQRQRLPTLSKRSHGEYAGSPAQMNFGEPADRGITIVNLEDAGEGWSVSTITTARVDDDASIAPLVRVTSAEQDIPETALLTIGRGVVLDKDTQKRVVKQIVDDEGINVDDVVAQVLSVLPFDPMTDDVRAICKSVRVGYKRAVGEDKAQAQGSSAAAAALARLPAIVDAAVLAYRSRSL